MKTETLTTWDLIAIESAIATMISSGTLNQNSGHVLLEKLNRAKQIRLIYADKGSKS